MRKSLIQIVLLLLISSFYSYSAEAKRAGRSHKKVTKKGSKSRNKSDLGTSFSFDAASVRGKYQINGQGIATVEDEKVLDDLLGLRRNFKDRENQELSRR